MWVTTIESNAVSKVELQFGCTWRPMVDGRSTFPRHTTHKVISLRFSAQICVGNWTGVLLLRDPSTPSSHHHHDVNADETYQSRSKIELDTQILLSATIIVMVPTLQYACQRTSGSNLVFLRRRQVYRLTFLPRKCIFSSSAYLKRED